MTRIRPFRAGDEEALADICVRTADAGTDATGILSDDAIWPAIFVLPYAARHPEYAFVVETTSETGDARVAGYIVGAPDTDAFEEWFRREWWPPFAARWPAPASDSREAGVLRYAAERRPGAEPHAAEYPAHLHIDLLPELQGGGWGRRLIEALADALRADGVTGLHLVASATNTGAIAFYARLGFTALPSPEGVQAFGRTL